MVSVVHSGPSAHKVARIASFLWTLCRNFVSKHPPMLQNLVARLAAKYQLSRVLEQIDSTAPSSITSGMTNWTPTIGSTDTRTVRRFLRRRSAKMISEGHSAVRFGKIRHSSFFPMKGFVFAFHAPRSQVFPIQA